MTRGSLQFFGVRAATGKKSKKGLVVEQQCCEVACQFPKLFAVEFEKEARTLSGLSAN